MARRSKKQKTAAVPETPATPEPVYRMAAPNECLLDWGGRLRDARVPVQRRDGLSGGRSICETTDGALGAADCWLEPNIFLPICDNDAGLQAAIVQAFKRRFSGPAMELVAKELNRVFEEGYLTKLVTEFDAVLGLVTQYMLAREAVRRVEAKAGHDDSGQTV